MQLSDWLANVHKDAKMCLENPCENGGGHHVHQDVNRVLLHHSKIKLYNAASVTC